MNCVALVLLVVTTHSAGAASAGDNSQETPKELQGTWIFNHAIVDGRCIEKSSRFNGTIEFVDGQLVETMVDSAGATTVVTTQIEFDQSKAPKELLMYNQSSVGTELTITHFARPRHAIYDVHDGRLIIRVGDDGQSEFHSNSAQLTVFKKQLEPSAAARRDVSPRRRLRHFLPNLVRGLRR